MHCDQMMWMLPEHERKKRQGVTHSRAHTATRVLCNLFLWREPTIDEATGTRFSDCNGGDSHQPFKTRSFNQKLQFACQIIQRKLFPNDDGAFRLDLLLVPPGTVLVVTLCVCNQCTNANANTLFCCENECA
uniref:(northern house mosquito) hypothetical protein n=1 Tax=Culex pipiens TaxID=7175 RepID=A0A8D8AN69_CULPI